MSFNTGLALALLLPGIYVVLGIQCLGYSVAARNNFNLRSTDDGLDLVLFQDVN